MFDNGSLLRRRKRFKTVLNNKETKTDNSNPNLSVANNEELDSNDLDPIGDGQADQTDDNIDYSLIENNNNTNTNNSNLQTLAPLNQMLLLTQNMEFGKQVKNLIINVRDQASSIHQNTTPTVCALKQGSPTSSTSTSSSCLLSTNTSLLSSSSSSSSSTSSSNTDIKTKNSNSFSIDSLINNSSEKFYSKLNTQSVQIKKSKKSKIKLNEKQIKEIKDQIETEEERLNTSTSSLQSSSRSRSTSPNRTESTPNSRCESPNEHNLVQQQHHQSMLNFMPNPAVGSFDAAMAAIRLRNSLSYFYSNQIVTMPEIMPQFYNSMLAMRAAAVANTPLAMAQFNQAQNPLNLNLNNQQRANQNLTTTTTTNQTNESTQQQQINFSNILPLFLPMHS